MSNPIEALTNTAKTVTGGYSGTSAQNALNSVINSQNQNYNQNFSPLVQDLINSSQSAQLVEKAKTKRGNALNRINSIQGRSRGLGTMTAAQQEALKSRNLLSTTASDDFAVNNARVNEDALNFQNMQQLMAIASQTEADAMNGLNSAASLASSREQAYQDARAQSIANNMNLAGTAAAAALVI